MCESIDISGNILVYFSQYRGLLGVGCIIAQSVSSIMAISAEDAVFCQSLRHLLLHTVCGKAEDANGKRRIGQGEENVVSFYVPELDVKCTICF